MFNLIDFLLGKKTTSPIPDERVSPQQAVGMMGQNVMKNLIYNPETKKIFPNSMMNNAPDVMQRQLSPEDLQSLISMIMPGPKAGNFRKFGKMYSEAPTLVSNPVPIKGVPVQSGFLKYLLPEKKKNK